MRQEKISRFHIEVCNSSLHKLDFALVYPPGSEILSPVRPQLINAYVNYHLAIKPKVPVIIFQLSTLIGVGSKIYGGQPNCPPIYHLPPHTYNDLEDIVLDDIFCVSQIYLEHVLNTKCLNKSIFGLLEETRQKFGLNVIGIENADTQT